MSIVPERRASAARIVGFVLLLSGVSWGLGALSAWPWPATPVGSATLRVSLKQVTALSAGTSAMTAEEIAKLPPHMRPPDGARAVTGRRADATLTVVIDGARSLSRTYRPTGLRHDGPVYAYEELPVPPGRHAIDITLAEGDAPERVFRVARTLDVEPGRAPLFEYLAGSEWQQPN